MARNNYTHYKLTIAQLHFNNESKLFSRENMITAIHTYNSEPSYPSAAFIDHERYPAQMTRLDKKISYRIIMTPMWTFWRTSTLTPQKGLASITSLQKHPHSKGERDGGTQSHVYF